MQCSSCGTINPSQARFCMGCGALLVAAQVCNHCHTLLPLQARFCYHCGTFQLQGAAYAPPAAVQPYAVAAPLPAPAVSLPPAPPVMPVQPPLQPPAAAVPAWAPPATVPAAAPAQPAPVPASPPAPPAAPEPAPAAPAAAQAGNRPVSELLPSLKLLLTDDLYDPLEGVPTPAQLNAARDHLSALIGTIKTYLPWPVVVSPQPAGIPAGGMYRGVFIFGDVSGFTPLSEKLKVLGQEGAEIMTRLINALFTDLVSALFDHGGTLLKFGGDAMLGLFPASNNEELAQGALQAAQTALAMQEVLKKEQFSAIQVLGETRSLQIKIGISAGPYFAAHIGTKPSETNGNGTMAYVTTGTTVNLAEASEGHANPGEIAMTRYVRELLGDRAELGPVNKEPDEDFFRLISAPPRAAGVQRLEIQEPPDADNLTQLNYLVDRLDRLTPYLPDELVARIVSNPKSARILPENRPVTVMFANYKGISRLIEKMGDSEPELITHHLNNYFVHMATIVERYEGTVARMDQYAVGDRLVIFFGAPRAHEDDPVRAITTALEMQEAVRQNFSALRTATGVYRFEQRIGVNTGVLFAGNAGAQDLRQEYTLMGDDINMAARLMSNAPWGDIYMSRRTKEAVEAYFEVEDKGELKVKGKAITIPTFKILGRRGEVGRTRGFDEGETAMIGRSQAFESFQKAARSFLTSKRGQIITIIGNSGLGKSRLLRESRAWLAGQEQAKDVLWIEARALSFSEQMNYWMATEVIRGMLSLKPAATQDDVLYALSERCEAYFGDDAMNATPYLAHMMGLDLGEEWAWVRSLDPKVRQKQTFRTATQFFTAAARERPIVIAMDDLHWADEASLALLENLLAATDKAALMFCLVFRARRDKLCWQLRDRAAADYAHRYTEINLEPLSWEQSIELLGQLLPGAQFQAETQREILDKTAGNPFYLEEVVRSLRESGAVERIPETPDRWRVTERISAIKVPGTLHAAIVARIDRLTEDTRQALQAAAVIGRQFRLGLFSNLTRAEEEINFWLSQLERGGLVRPSELSDDPLYNFPDALVQEVAYESLLVQNRQQLHRRVADTLEEHYAHEAEETGQNLDQLLSLNCELLAYHFSRSDSQEKAIKYLEMAAKKSRDSYANETAIQFYQQLLEIRRKTGDRAGEAGALSNMGVIAYEIGAFDRSRPWLEEAAAIQAASGDQKSQGWSVMYVGMVELKQANYANATRCHTQAMELAHNREDKFQEGIHLTNLARVSMRLGQYDLALDQFQQSLDMKKAMVDINGVGFALFYRGLIYTYQGHYDDAEASLQGAFQAWSQVAKNERVMSYYNYGAGLLALGRQQYGQACEYLQKATDLSTKLELRAETIDNLSAFSQARLGQGDTDAALELSSQAIRLLAAQKDVEEIQQIYLDHARVLAARNDPQAAEYLQRAYDTMIERAHRLEDPEQQRIYLEQVRVNQEISAGLNAPAAT